MFAKLKAFLSGISATKAIALLLAAKAVLSAFGVEVEIPQEAVDILIAPGLVRARRPGAAALKEVKANAA